jgi:SAM-dependent methyltransferase
MLAGPNRAQRVTRYSPREYWTRLARDFARDDATGVAPVLHPGTPYWFNEAIDSLQIRAWGRVLDRCELGKRALLLDVGCGTGRWLRRCGQRELSTVGVDQSLATLHLPRQRATFSPLFAGEIQNLPVLDESFDCVRRGRSFGITLVRKAALLDASKNFGRLITINRAYCEKNLS